jgi:hypothetical protein
MKRTVEKRRISYIESVCNLIAKMFTIFAWITDYAVLNGKVNFNNSTVKPVYLKHVDNWFLKLDLYYFNKYVFKNHLSTRLR